LLNFLRTNVRVHSETKKKIVAGSNSSHGDATIALWKSAPMTHAVVNDVTLSSYRAPNRAACIAAVASVGR